MNFESVVSDDPVFPVEELPKQRLYRPDLGDPHIRALWGKFVFIGVLIAVPCGIVAKKNGLALSGLEALLSLIVFTFLALLAYTLYLQRKSAQIARVSEVLGLTAEGKLAEAAVLADEITRHVESIPHLYCYALYERAGVAALQGEYLLANGISGAITRSNALRKPSNPLHVYWGLNLSSVASNYACLGRIKDAEVWLAYARRFVPENLRGAFMSTDLIIGIRTGRAAVVVADTERDWCFAERVLRASGIRTIRMLCAFGLSQINSDGTKTEAIERWLASLHPHTPGDFNSFAANWPELQAFISEKKL